MNVDRSDDPDDDPSGNGEGDNIDGDFTKIACFLKETSNICQSVVKFPTQWLPYDNLICLDAKHKSLRNDDKGIDPYLLENGGTYDMKAAQSIDIAMHLVLLLWHRSKAIYHHSNKEAVLQYQSETKQYKHSTSTKLMIAAYASMRRLHFVTDAALPYHEFTRGLSATHFREVPVAFADDSEFMDRLVETLVERIIADCHILMKRMRGKGKKAKEVDEAEPLNRDRVKEVAIEVLNIYPAISSIKDIVFEDDEKEGHQVLYQMNDYKYEYENLKLQSKNLQKIKEFHMKKKEDVKTLVRLPDDVVMIVWKKDRVSYTSSDHPAIGMV